MGIPVNKKKKPLPHFSGWGKGFSIVPEAIFSAFRKLDRVIGV